MKKILVLLIFTFLLNRNADAQWEITPIDSAIYGSKILFINNSTGFFTGSDGIYKTADAGNHWNQVYKSNKYSLFNDIQIIDSIGYAVGYEADEFTGTIIKTTNTGKTWVKLSLPYVRFLSYLYCRSKDEIYALSIVGKILKSTNAGADWELTAELQGQGFIDLIEYRNKLYTVESFFGNCWSSADGVTWNFSGQSPIVPLGLIEFNDHFCAYGSDTTPQGTGVLSLSSNQGQNWINQTATERGLQSISFVNSNIWYAVDWVGASGYNNSFIYTTTNGGINWESIKKFDSVSIENIAYTDNYIYFVGTKMLREDSLHITKGVVIRHQLSTIGVESNNTSFKGYNLSQNYPNPFNPSTKIGYVIPISGHVELKIYTITGEKVATVVDGVKNAGYYVAEFTATNLASGIYFYKVTAGNFTSVKKMILVK